MLVKEGILNKAISIAKPRAVEAAVVAKKLPDFDLAEYPGLQPLYVTRANLAAQFNALSARGKEIMRELDCLDGSKNVDKEVEDLLAGKSIDKLSSKTIENKNKLERELSDLDLKKMVLSKAQEKLQGEIDVLEVQAKGIHRKHAQELLDEQRLRIKQGLDMVLDAHKEVVAIHRAARALGGVDGRTYFTADGWNEAKLKVKESSIQVWWNRSGFETNE